jgi:hypothetical protein
MATDETEVRTEGRTTQFSNPADTQASPLFASVTAIVTLFFFGRGSDLIF